MHITVIPASLAQKPVIGRLLELYQYDFSEFDGADLDANGVYGYRYLDHYWVEPTRVPFLITVAGQPAGCVLVNHHTLLPSNQVAIASSSSSANTAALASASRSLAKSSTVSRSVGRWPC